MGVITLTEHLYETTLPTTLPCIGLDKGGSDMVKAKPTAYTKGQINRSGEAIRGRNPNTEAFEIINKWRASHAYILNTFQAMLRNRTRNTKIAVAQRHKRLITIAGKLFRQPKMELARMDDIAGCRLIFPNIKILRSFRDRFHKAKFVHKRKNAVDKYDYITKPKNDGYRGIHDIYEYETKSAKGEPYNGLLLELQYRTIYQHAWATTVEIIGMVTVNQPKFHAGDERHIEFFKLASEIIARAYEDCTGCYPDISSDEIAKRFNTLDSELRIMALLRNLKISAEKIGTKKNVILVFSGNELEVFSYAKMTDALKRYFLLEQTRKGSDIVLVKSDTGADIRLSYRSFFSDPDDFIKFITEGCKKLAS